MVNAVKQIHQWLGYGANALEVDVKFTDDGTPSYFYMMEYHVTWVETVYVGHTLRTTFKLFEIEHILTARNLIAFDVKLKKLNKNVLSNAGVRFTDDILIPLYENNPTKMKIMISVPNLTLKESVEL